MYGASRGPILLDNVQCRGSETNIQDCVHKGWGNSNCGHAEDAGVICGIEYVRRKYNKMLGNTNCDHAEDAGMICGKEYV